MDVFSPAQARSKAEERSVQEINRARAIAEATATLLKEQEEIDAAFKVRLKENQATAETWFLENTERKNQLLREVELLEKRREQALIPPFIKAEDIHSTEEALWARKLELDARESSTEGQCRLLMKKLDEVSEKETDLASREKRVKAMELGAEDQKNSVALSAKKLNKRIEEFERDKENREAELAFQDSELDARENLYNERDLMLKKREEEIETAKRLLADQRHLLDRGFEELRRLKDTHERRIST